MAGSPNLNEHELPISRGLIIKPGPLSKILAGTKTWEIRGANCSIRGRIALIESGSGMVVGTAELIDVLGPLTLSHLQRHWRKAGFQPESLPYTTTYAWVMRGAERLSRPIAYNHPQGAIIWVHLSKAVSACVKAALGQ